MPLSCALGRADLLAEVGLERVDLGDLRLLVLRAASRARPGGRGRRPARRHRPARRGPPTSPTTSGGEDEEGHEPRRATARDAAGGGRCPGVPDGSAAVCALGTHHRGDRHRASKLRWSLPCALARWGRGWRRRPPIFPPRSGTLRTTTGFPASYPGCPTYQRFRTARPTLTMVPPTTPDHTVTAPGPRAGAPGGGRRAASGPDEDPPERAEDQERPERHVRPPVDPPRREQHDQHDARRRAGPPASPVSARSEPEHQPDPDQQLHVADPERARPERDRQRGRAPSGTTIATRIAGQRSLPTSGFRPVTSRSSGERDDRQRQLVGQEPLVEIHREPDDEVANHGPEQRQGERPAPSNRLPQQRRTRTRRSARADDRPPADRLGRPGSPRRAPASESRADRRKPTPPRRQRARRDDVIRRREGARRGTRSGSYVARPGQRELDERRVGHAGRAAGRVRRRLPEVARPADVEMGPRHRPELAQEQAALDRASPRPSRSSGGRRTSSPCPAT